LPNNNQYEYSLSGNSDYLYDQIYLGRNTTNGFLNQQFAVTDGGFKNLTTTKTGDRWLNAINIKSNLLTQYLSAYLDFGIVGFVDRDSQGNEIDGVTDATYNAGLAINLIPNIFEIYLPVYMSSDLNQLNYGEKIRFTLNINQLNPFKIVRDFEL